MTEKSRYKKLKVSPTSIFGRAKSRRLKKELSDLQKKMPPNVSIGTKLPDNHETILARNLLRANIARDVWRRRFTVAMGHDDPGSSLYCLDRGQMMLRVIMSFMQTSSDALQKFPIIEPAENTLYGWRAIIAITDEPQCPYNNGIFSLDISIPRQYPFEPPKCNFSTPIYHPRISKDGTPCLDVLSYKWCPALNIAKVVWALRDILIQEPLPTGDFESVPANRDAKRLFTKDRASFDKKAREYTQKHARVDKLGECHLPLPSCVRLS